MLRKAISVIAKANRRRTAKLVFVHVGKCAGSTILRHFQEQGLDVFQEHVTQVKFQKGKRYIVALRNPMARQLSAYNWRKRLVYLEGDRKDQFPGEYDVFDKFQSFSDYLEALYLPDGQLRPHERGSDLYVHHFPEGLAFHLNDILRNASPETIQAVVCQEHLSDDMQRCFEITVKHRERANTSERPTLSPQAHENLLAYCEDDFRTIEQLNKQGHLTQQQYVSLSNRDPFATP